MADTARLSGAIQVDQGEADDLRSLARGLIRQTPRLSDRITAACSAFDAALASAARPLQAERAAEIFASTLRSIWLEAAGREAASVFRSPTDSQARRVGRRHDAFGYERDLQPESLETRLAHFFPPPPPGWRQDHLIFSSGQAAMTCALLGLSRHLAPDRGQIRLTHRGAYFETRSLIRALPFIAEATFAETADIVIDEPICCDGQFHQIDTAKLFSASPRAVIFDTTLQGRDDGVDRYLAALEPGGKQVVLRIASCLKLFQGGLELANAGVLSLYASNACANGLGDRLRALRTLTGSGLHLVDAIALEAPWVFDAEHADAYTAALFDHNARLAHAVAAANQRFEPVQHPALTGGAAPFCAFRLKARSPTTYDALDREIAAEATRRRLMLSRGGSFGFRGHRFEIVKPETGDPPFLRVALGRRGGWSCDGLIEMFADISAASSG